MAHPKLKDCICLLCFAKFCMFLIIDSLSFARRVFLSRLLQLLLQLVNLFQGLRLSGVAVPIDHSHTMIHSLSMCFKMRLLLTSFTDAISALRPSASCRRAATAAAWASSAASRSERSRSATFSNLRLKWMLEQRSATSATRDLKGTPILK